MKKTFVTMFVIVALVLSSSINARAFAGSDIKVHTRASVASAFETQQLNNIAQNIYNFVPSSTNWVNVSKVYAKLNILPSSVLNYSHYILIIRNGNLQLLCFNGDSSTIFVNTGGIAYKDTIYSANDQSTGLGYVNIPVVNGGYSYTLYDCAWSESSQWSGQGYDSSSSDNYYSMYFGGTIISTNIPLYFYEELNMNSIQHTGVTAGNLYAYPDLYNQLTDFAHVNLPYEDGDGNIVDPTPVVESNSNHMYFKGCEIGFCEPYNQNNFSNYGGAYVYIRYQVDDWIVNHISDYSLDIQLLKVVGSNQETYSKSVLLDRDGCVEIPLSDFTRSGSAVPNSGFDVAVVNNIVEDNYYKSYLYCVQGDLANFVSKNSGVDVTSHTYNNPWGSLKDGVLSSIYFYQVTTETYNLMDNQALQAAIAARQTYNPYIFRIQVNLVSGEDRSGDVATKFDLVTGDQSDVSTSGFVNPDPFIPDTSDPNFLPSVPGDNSTIPSTIVYTGGTFTGNFNGVIGFDPGYRELKQDLDADPDDNFTQYLAPFKNNEVGGFVGDFLDDMPTALKSIFIGGFGVLTLLGIYRFIRRG